MSEIQHKSLKAELLYLIGRASAPPHSAELYEKCELADEIVQVSKELSNLQTDGKIVRVEGEGRARYKLADGVAAPAPAGKSGRSKAVQKDDTAQAVHQAPAAPAVIPEFVAPVVRPEPVERTARADHIAAPGKMVDPGAESLADAMIARLKRDLGPLLRPSVTADLDVTTAPAAITVNVDRVEIHISVGVRA